MNLESKLIYQPPNTNLAVQLSWVLNMVALNGSFLPSSIKPLDFVETILLQRQRLVMGGWIFYIGQYGNLCAVIHTARIAKEKLSSILKWGPSAVNSEKYFVSKIDQPNQLVLMDFWCEIGYGKEVIEHMRDLLRPQNASIIYFRVKNGKRIAKMLMRNDATTFMRSSRVVQSDNQTPFLATEAARYFYLPTYSTQMAFAQCVGEMALLMVHAPMALASPIKPVLERIQTCAKLQQHKLYEFPNGTSAGLVTWGWLTKKRMRTDSFDTNALQAFEWSEGAYLAVVDVVISLETEAAVWADLAGLLYPDEDIWLLCRVGEITFFKKWAKNQRKELLTNPQARTFILYGKWHDITGRQSCLQ